MIFRYPVNYIGITSLFGNRTYTSSNGVNITDFHAGIDLGWKEPYKDGIYSIEEGTIVHSGTDDIAGNFVVISHTDKSNTWISRYLHLNSLNTSKGSYVTKGTKIGVMGSTGDTSGCHLHIEIWKCPLGYIYSYEDQKKYAVDPTNYLFANFDQEISVKSNYSYLVKRLENLSYTENKISKGSVLKVKNTGSNLRTEPSTRLGNLSIMGTIPIGDYEALATTNEVIDDYIWCKINYGNHYWVALILGSTELKEVELDPEPELDPKPDPISEPDPEPISDFEDKYKLIFKCPKNGAYYIKLYLGDELYRKQ